MSVRAECVMLNKGKYIVKTIKTLDDILTRQQGHVNKKRYIMRRWGLPKRLFIHPETRPSIFLVHLSVHLPSQ